MLALIEEASFIYGLSSSFFHEYAYTGPFQVILVYWGSTNDYWDFFGNKDKCYKRNGSPVIVQEMLGKTVVIWFHC